jgi:transcriptional antiterminator NusG
LSDHISEAAWYVVHTYSGYENKVKANLEKTVENRNMQDVILEVKVPVEDVVEVKKDGKKHIVQRKIFPGYVMVKMVMTNQAWYVVRNTRGVTGFVGPESKPIPLTEAEIDNMGVTGAPQLRYGFEVGDMVMITDGPMENFNGVILELDYGSQKAAVEVSMFGREIRVELEFSQISKM